MTNSQANTMYGAKISYFTGKLRAYFDYKKIPYVEKIADLKVYQEIIVPRVGWPVIPVVVTSDDETLQDTSEIIDYFEQRFVEKPVYPEGARQQFVGRLIEMWADEWLKLPAMHYRWNHNFEFILGEFGRLSRPDLNEQERIEVGRKTSQQFAGSLPVLGVNDETASAIEHSYEALLGELQRHFEVHDYLLGGHPTIADFGLYGPLYAHMYLDPASGDLMKRLAPKVVGWIERMTNGATSDRGALLNEDRIPETLLPVLTRLFAEYLPVLEVSVAALQTWLEENSAAAEVPRFLGMTSFELGGINSQRGLFTFDQWMLQRVMDHYESVNEREKESIQELLAPLGGARLVEIPMGHRVERRAFKLVAQ